jgi:ferredoxin-NADP reductase
MALHDSIAAYLDAKVEIAAGLAIFRFALARDFIFKPGQHATLWLTHRGVTTPRPYSITSSPSNPRVLEFYINLVADGHLTPSLWDPEVLEGLQKQDPRTTVEFTGPKGLLVLDPEDRRDLAFIASGTGLAPFISMIRKLNEDYLSNPREACFRRIWVVHGVSYSAHLGFREELQQLATETLSDPNRRLQVVYLPTVSRPHLDPAWSGLTGRAETLFEDSHVQDRDPAGINCIVRGMLRTALRPQSHAVYICGHPGTIAAVVIALNRRAFAVETDLKHERYYPQERA